MASPPKRTSLTALQDWACSTPHSLPQDTAKQGPARHSSPRFSSDTKGTHQTAEHQTAEHHSLSRPRTLSGEEPDNVIPGAFPDDSKRSRSLGRTATQDKTHSNLANPPDSKNAPVQSELPNSESSSGSRVGVISTEIPPISLGQHEDLSLETENPIPAPHHPGSNQPYLQPESKRGDTAVRTTHQAKESDFASAQGSTTHAGSSIIQEIEEAAVEVYHEAEHMLHDVGEAVSAYFSGGGGKDTERDRGETIPTQTKPSGASAPDPKSANQPERTSQIPDIHVHMAEGTSIQLPAEQGVAESMRGMKISGNTTTLPHTIQHEYFRSNEYDLYGDRLDTSEFLFDDDASDQEVDPIPGEGSKAARRTLGGKEIGVGYGGVEYYLEGHGGILPGYPTPEGMRKLMLERMEDDRLRAAGAENPSTSSPLSGPSTSGEPENTVRGRSQIIKGELSVSTQAPHNELVSEGSPAEISPDSRIVGEKREVPVFVTGEPAAAGKYEAIFEPVVDEPEKIQPQKVGEAALFKEGVNPDIGSETA